MINIFFIHNRPNNQKTRSLIDHRHNDKCALKIDTSILTEGHETKQQQMHYAVFTLAVIWMKARPSSTDS